ncbi:aspartate/glutamate racemase family protein [Streptomyces sp. NPDC048385]|uniref:aspartate/glutamate racemase family protein n=1 Tax=unclassified Streptomyces TaxID=2593676 RepID=UPI003429013B
MLALLHTSPLHVPVFDALRDEHHPGLELRHFVAPDLLSRARGEGPDAVAQDVTAALHHAAENGVQAVLCTCSTIGEVAERAADEVGVPVIRGDRPMAAAAVAAGPRIAVLATVESTLTPTLALLDDEARRAARPIRARAQVVPEAWTRFEAGDVEGCARLVAATADGVTDADVILLAQASMTPAARITTTALPILSSPRPGLAAAAAAVRTGSARATVG